MADQRREEGFTPLSPVVFHILLSLTDRPLHGYGIMQHVKSVTEGKVRVGPGTLYGAIKRLLEVGHIREVEAPDPDEDERRRYYDVTDLGRDVVRREALRMEELVSIARARSSLWDLQPNQAGV